MEGPRLDRAPRDPATPLARARIVVCVGGGIAAYKAAELVRLLDKAGAQVDVAMTGRAQKFIGAMTFQALTRHPVFTDLFSLTEEATIGHIQLADGADLMIVAPATASSIARLAAGMADDPVTAIALATKAPVLVAPSMNVNMWGHPITRANVRRLVDTARYHVVGPGEGFLACRWTGPGRLAEPADIVEAAAHLLSRQDLAGKHLVVSAGPTYEAIDPVRFVGNRSSGKMGIALAAAARRGGKPLLVGFAAETEHLLDNARAKLAAKKCDLIVANDVGEPAAGFAVDTNHVQLVDAHGVVDVPPGPKTEVAHRILDRVVELLATPAGRAPGTSRTARAPRPRSARAGRRRSAS
jgi:phosphopantothenoylcysteine synthetase/decarboxylase